jgi:multisubunit Na+/H+ antiporter MnhC subunit
VLRFIVGLGLFFVLNAEMIEQLFGFEVMFRDFVVLIFVVFGK